LEAANLLDAMQRMARLTGIVRWSVVVVVRIDDGEFRTGHR
jgi:hypothetical protein